MSTASDERVWLRLRSYLDGAASLDVVLSQLLDVACEIEELAEAGFALQEPAVADGMVLRRPVDDGPRTSP